MSVLLSHRVQEFNWPQSYFFKTVDFFWRKLSPISIWKASARQKNENCGESAIPRLKRRVSYDRVSGRISARYVTTEKEKYFGQEDADLPVVRDGRVVEGRQAGGVLGDDVASKRGVALRQDSWRQRKNLEYF